MILTVDNTVYQLLLAVTIINILLSEQLHEAGYCSENGVNFTAKKSGAENSQYLSEMQNSCPVNCKSVPRCASTPHVRTFSIITI